jgi:photosystem II stability/assembly factor-like uncharacterized protein
MRLFIFLQFLFYCNASTSQTLKILTSGEKTSIRGLSVVSDKIIWASGSNGMIARSIDGGNSWKWLRVKGFEKTDFRDIEAFDATTAVIMGIAEPAYILKTSDAGETWRVVYENKTKGMFLDAMDFHDAENGVVVGDPIEKMFFIARTFDGGNTWREITKQNNMVADSGEACFASSGTNIKSLSKDEICFVSGGLRSRLFIKDKQIDLPMIQGKESTGANSIAVKNKKNFIVVGGDFNTPDSTTKNCYVTKNAGKTWTAPNISPHGYRSCVEYLEKKNWITCGLNGINYSSDNGNTWHWISKESFHVVRKAKYGKAVFLAGSNGKIGKLNRF